MMENKTLIIPEIGEIEIVLFPPHSILCNNNYYKDYQLPTVIYGNGDALWYKDDRKLAYRKGKPSAIYAKTGQCLWADKNGGLCMPTGEKYTKAVAKYYLTKQAPWDEFGKIYLADKNVKLFLKAVDNLNKLVEKILHKKETDEAKWLEQFKLIAEVGL